MSETATSLAEKRDGVRTFIISMSKPYWGYWVVKAVCESSTIAMKIGYADASGWMGGNGRSYVEKKGRKDKLERAD